jgi:hypothetical protein
MVELRSTGQPEPALSIVEGAAVPSWIVEVLRDL